MEVRRHRGQEGWEKKRNRVGILISFFCSSLSPSILRHEFIKLVSDVS